MEIKKSDKNKDMGLKREKSITFSNLVNKYNNSIYSSLEDPEDEYIYMIGMYSAS